MEFKGVQKSECYESNKLFALHMFSNVFQQVSEYFVNKLGDSMTRVGFFIRIYMSPFMYLCSQIFLYLWCYRLWFMRHYCIHSVLLQARSTSQNVTRKYKLNVKYGFGRCLAYVQGVQKPGLLLKTVSLYLKQRKYIRFT